MSLQLYQALAPVVRPGDLPSQLREIRNSFEAVECLPKALRVDVWKAFHIQVKPLLADIKDPQLPGIVRPIEYSIERRQPVAEYQASSYAERLAHYFMEGAIQGRGLSLETDRALIEGMLSAAHPRRYTPTYIDAGNTVTEWLRMDPSQWMEIIEPNVRQRASQFMSFLSTVRSLYVFLRESTPSILVPDLEIKLMAFNRLAASYHPQLKACDDVMLQLIFEPSEEHFVTYLKSRNLPSTVEATLETVDLSKASAGLVAKRGEEGPGVRVCYHGVLDEEGQVRAQPHFYLVDMGEGLTIQINIPKKTCELVFQEKRDERSLPLFHVDRIYCDKADYVVRYLEALPVCRVVFLDDLEAKMSRSFPSHTHSELAMGLMVDQCQQGIPHIESETYGDELFEVIDRRLQDQHGEYLARLGIDEAGRQRLVRTRLEGLPTSRGELFKRMLVGVSYFENVWADLKDVERAVLNKDQELRQFLHWMIDPSHPANPKHLKENAGVSIYVDERRSYHEAFDKLWRSLNGSSSPLRSDSPYPFEAVTLHNIPETSQGHESRGRLGQVRDELVGTQNLFIIRNLHYPRKEVLDIPAYVSRVSALLPELISYTWSQLQFELEETREFKIEMQGIPFRLTPASYRDTLLSLGEEVNNVAQALKQITGGSTSALDRELEALGFAPPKITSFSMSLGGGSALRSIGDYHFAAPSTLSSDAHVRSQAQVDARKLDRFLNFLKTTSPYNQVRVAETEETLVEYFNRLLLIINHAAHGDYASEHAEALVEQMLGKSRIVTEHRSFTTFWNSFWGGESRDTLVSTSERKMILGLDGSRHWTARARFELRYQDRLFDITHQAEPPRSSIAVTTSRRWGSVKYTILTRDGQYRLARA